jgi:hypothetical protein
VCWQLTPNAFPSPSHLRQLQDLFVSAAQLQLTLLAAHVRQHMTPAYVELSLAVADQVGRCSSNEHVCEGVHACMGSVFSYSHPS